MSVGLFVGTTENDLTMEGLFDLDFIQNEEFFRQDTIALGYRNEAERVIKENKDENGNYDIEEIIAISMASDYYKDYKVSIVDVNSIKVISIAFNAE